MIYNCYIKDNQYYVDVAKSDLEVVTKKYKFSMKLGFLGKNIPDGGYKIIEEKYKELYLGSDLTVIEFSNHFKYRTFLKDSENKLIFGDIDPVYHCIASHFIEPLKMFNPRFYTLDIEVYCKNGFPDPTQANNVINLITVCDYQNEKYYTWGLKPFKNETEFDVDYNHCNDEVDLLNSVIEFIDNENVKCFTGWNTNGFDVPYIINRLIRLRDKSYIIDEFIKENINTYGRDKSFKTIQVIDYMELYKKFKAIKLERYSLDFVSLFEGFQGKKKMNMTLTDASDNFWSDYVVYNIIDNYAIIQLENKLKYIKQAFSMANDNKCLPVDIFSPVKLWDCATYFELYNNHKCLVPPVMNDVSMKLLGGYVGIPNSDGFQKFISVFDISSSYPHQIMQFGIGPETLISEKKLHPDLMAIRQHYKPSVKQMNECPDKQFKNDLKSFKKQLKRKGIDLQENSEELGEVPTTDLNLYRVKYNVWRFSQMDLDEFPFTEVLKKHNVTMTCNLQFYKKEKIGIIPFLIDKYFKVRNEAKHNEELLEFHIDKIQKQIGVNQKSTEESLANVFVLDDIEMIDDDLEGEEDEIFEMD